MLRATSERSNAHYVAHAVVRLEILDDNDQFLSWATGFVVNERDFLSLYTCWHVVTGADPYNLPSTIPIRRAKIRVHTLGVESRQPGVTVVGGLSTFEIDLFDNDGQRKWFQDINVLHTSEGTMPVPTYDCVRFNIESFGHLIPGSFQPDDDILNYLDISEDAYIVGFPYGYSAADTGPDPIFIRRSRASIWAPQSFTLLDGAGAKGMSGGPVVTRTVNEWRLAGIYSGVVFPEARFFEEEIARNHGKSQLPLGKYTMSMIARQAVGVSSEDIGLTSVTGS